MIEINLFLIKTTLKQKTTTSGSLRPPPLFFFEGLVAEPLGSAREQTRVANEGGYGVVVDHWRRGDGAFWTESASHLARGS